MITDLAQDSGRGSRLLWTPDPQSSVGEFAVLGRSAINIGLPFVLGGGGNIDFFLFVTSHSHSFTHARSLDSLECTQEVATARAMRAEQLQKVWRDV